MSGQDLELTLRLKADRSGLRGEIRMTKADIEQLTKQMDDAGKEADQTSKQMDKLGKKTEEVGNKSKTLKDRLGSVKGMLASLGVALTVGAMTSMISTQLNAADAIQKTSIRIGASTEALSEYRHVADLTGVQIDTLTTAWQRQARRVAEAAQGSGEAADALKELGVDAQALNQLRPDQQFEILADAMNEVRNQSDRVRLAMRLWDTEGVALLQTIDGGAESLRTMRQEAHELGMTLSREQVDAAAAANDAMTRLGRSSNALAQTAAIHLAPVLTEAADIIREYLPGAVDIATRALNIGRAALMKIVQGLFKFNEGVFASLAAVAEWIPGLGDAKTKLEEMAASARKGADMSGELASDYLNTAIATDNVGKSAVNVARHLDNKLNPSLYRTEKISRGTASAIKEQSKWMDDLLDSYIKEEEENAKLFDTKEQLISSLKDELELTQYTGRELAIQTKIRANHARGIYDQDAAIRQLVGSIYDANAAAKAAEEQADPFADAWAEATKRIDESFADAWRGAFDSFDAFSRSLLQAFQNLLAELAHQAITKPILISLGLGGGMVGGTASAATGGTGGSLLQAGFSSITDSLGIGNMFSGGVGLSSLSTMASYGLSAGSGGLLAGATQGGMLAAQTAEFGLSGAMLTSDALGGAAAAGGGLSGALAAAAPWLMAAAFIAPLIGGMLKGGTPHLGGMTEFDMSGGTTNIDRNAWGGDATGIPSWVFTPVGQDNRFGEPLDVLGQTSIAAINQALAAAGLSADGLNLRYGFAADGEDPTGGYGAVMMGGDVVFDSFARYAKDAEQGFEQFASDILPKVVNAALAAAVKSSDWMDDLKALALSFEGSDSFAEVVAAFGTLQEYLNTDPIEAYQTAVEASSRTLWDSMQTQYNSVMDLANAYDGSAASATSLAHNTQAFFQTTMQMLAQLDAAQNSINMTIGNAVEQITLSRMTDQEKYDYYRGAVDDLVALLPTLTDSTTINQTVSDITQAAKAAYGLLSPEQQIGSMGDQILGLLSGGYTDEEGNHIGVQEMANQLINDTRDSVVTMTETLGDTIDQKLKEAAAEFKAAAAQNQQAADTNTAAANNMGAGIDRLIAWANDLLPNDQRTVWLPSVGGR